ncbi:uncharacterized protein EV154DRAFT_495115 [Mucor mucedo]|uniref:uncharacterized protein n=1 Tax=Mucor mucedo TaxID=29922 RepID=UPI00221EC911|nr:uncharacterized protein EV154DRAFT_495115 [Mucor mucedo]KAI7895496.1 hypothetical protein EV154DRAFT_495115 [Mucor mucedo]
MTENNNNLFQLAQVVTELPHQQQPSSPLPHSRSNEGHHPLLARKNACIVCAVCFTCSGYYGSNCHCLETQPRRGKNLPEGGLDSRAKKLSRQDRDDYEFTLKWLDEFTHSIYRDREQNIIGLNDLTEVSLCKAHSSTLYRAKKRHQRNMNQAPPSPADSNGTIMEDYPLLPQPHFSSGYSGALAAKVREISFQQQQQQQQQQSYPVESPDFSMMTTSTSVKRKRTVTKLDNKPSSSASTPLFTNHMSPPPSLLLGGHNHQHNHHHHIHHPQEGVNNNNNRPTNSFSSQLPPLHLRTPSLSSLSSTLQHQLHVTPTFNTNYRHTPGVIETVSLKSSPLENRMDSIYYIRNLAITDSYTFKDLLSEIDFAGPPPPGKRVVISDVKRERIFPLGQAIRSVIRYPTDSHVEFYLGLADKASIDWSNYK